MANRKNTTCAKAAAKVPQISTPDLSKSAVAPHSFAVAWLEYQRVQSGRAEIDAFGGAEKKVSELIDRERAAVFAIAAAKCEHGEHFAAKMNLLEQLLVDERTKGEYNDARTVVLLASLRQDVLLLWDHSELHRWQAEKAGTAE